MPLLHALFVGLLALGGYLAGAGYFSGVLIAAFAAGALGVVYARVWVS